MFGANLEGTIIGLAFLAILLVIVVLAIRATIRGRPEIRRRAAAIREAAAKAEADRKALIAEVRKRAGPDLFISPIDRGILAINRESHEVILVTMAKPIFVPFGKSLTLRYSLTAQR